jgi:hypothetical protein
MMTRGNLRRSVFEDERDHQRLLEGLEQTIRRFGRGGGGSIIVGDRDCELRGPTL